VAKVEIHLWWRQLELRPKQWLRENTGTNVVPDHVAEAVRAAGGELTAGTLTPREWDFIVTQSEFVD
jgi:hypothetical protein